MWIPVDAETERPFRLRAADYPCLIHGTRGSGASFFTIAMAADLLRHGRRVLFCCQYADGVMALEKELQTSPTVRANDMASPATETLSSMSLITICRRHPAELLRDVRALPPDPKRIWILKNCDQLLNDEVWNLWRNHPQAIVSGDVAETAMDIHEHQWGTTVAFSDWPASWPTQRGTYPSYLGEAKISGRVQTVFCREKNDT